MGPEFAFWFFQAKDFVNLGILAATVLAIIIGPIWSVKITRASDERREAAQRKSNIFTSLMKTRKFQLNPEHVMALNLVQVEFYHNAKVLAAHRHYMTLLYRPIHEANDPTLDRALEENDDALYDLLYEIGVDVGYQFDKRDLKKLAYGPKGWIDEETQLRNFRQLMVEVLLGKRGFPTIDYSKVQAAQAVMNGKFPPPPLA